jgi:hypothetical protein
MGVLSGAIFISGWIVGTTAHAAHVRGSEPIDERRRLDDTQRRDVGAIGAEQGLVALHGS